MWSYASSDAVAPSTTSASPASIARSSGLVTSVGSSSTSPKESANFEALSTLMASRRPIFIWPTSKAASVPSLAEAAQYRTASEPCSTRRSIGVTTLPLDLLIFLRSGSRMNPLMAACRHGSSSNSRCERTTVENSQVRMMSCACGRRSMGNTRANRSSSASQPPAIWGVSELVAQVSMMSGSPVKPPGTSRWSAV